MIIDSILTLTLTALALFCSLLVIAALFCPKATRQHTQMDSDGISIVIPCRNEALNIPRLFASLAQQKHSGPLELIIVDDGSTDTTAEVVQQQSKRVPFPVICLQHQADASCTLTRKQQALDFGISKASHDLIALTDADMQLLPEWAHSLALAMSNNADLTFGHTAITPEKSIFSFFQSFQLGFLFMTALLLHCLRIPGSCMGNNIMIRKKTYLELGGQKSIGYAVTEDRALLEHYVRKKRLVRPTNPFVPTAITLPHYSISLFVHQMLRWARGGLHGSKYLILLGVGLTLQHAVLIMTIVGYHNNLHRLLAIFTFLAIWIMVAVTFTKNRVPVTPLLFPLYYLVLISETVLIPVLAIILRKIQWKNSSI